MFVHQRAASQGNVFPSKYVCFEPRKQFTSPAPGKSSVSSAWQNRRDTNKGRKFSIHQPRGITGGREECYRNGRQKRFATRITALPQKQQRALQAYDKDHMSLNCVQWTDVIIAFGRLGRQDKMEEAFSKIECPDCYNWGALLSGYSGSGKPEKAEEAMRSMKSAGIRPDRVTFSILMQAYAKKGDTERFAEMVLTGEMPDDVAFNTLLKAYAKRGDSKSAEKVCRRMEQAGVDPDIYTLNTLILAHVNHEDMERAERVLEKMEELSIQPTVLTFGTLMKGYVKQNRVAEAERVLLAMHRAGVEPNVVAYNTLILAYVKNGQVAAAESILQKMIVMGIQPSLVTFTTLMKAHAKRGNSKDAENLMQRMMRANIKPDKYAFSALMKAHINSNNVAKAEEVLFQMRQAKIRPNSVTWTTLMQGYSNHGDVDSAERIFARISEPDCISFNTLLQAYVKSCDEDGACHVLARMRNANIQQNDSTSKILQRLNTTSMRKSQESPLPSTSRAAISRGIWDGECSPRPCLFKSRQPVSKSSDVVGRGEGTSNLNDLTERFASLVVRSPPKQQQQEQQQGQGNNLYMQKNSKILCNDSGEQIRQNRHLIVGRLSCNRGFAEWRNNGGPRMSFLGHFGVHGHRRHHPRPPPPHHHHHYDGPYYQHERRQQRPHRSLTRSLRKFDGTILQLENSNRHQLLPNYTYHQHPQIQHFAPLQSLQDWKSSSFSCRRFPPPETGGGHNHHHHHDLNHYHQGASSSRPRSYSAPRSSIVSGLTSSSAAAGSRGPLQHHQSHIFHPVCFPISSSTESSLTSDPPSPFSSPTTSSCPPALGHCNTSQSLHQSEKQQQQQQQQQLQHPNVHGHRTGLNNTSLSSSSSLSSEPCWTPLVSRRQQQQYSTPISALFTSAATKRNPTVPTITLASMPSPVSCSPSPAPVESTAISPPSHPQLVARASMKDTIYRTVDSSPHHLQQHQQQQQK